MPASGRLVPADHGDVHALEEQIDRAEARKSQGCEVRLGRIVVVAGRGLALAAPVALTAIGPTAEGATCLTIDAAKVVLGRLHGIEIEECTAGIQPLVDGGVERALLLGRQVM